MNIAQPSVTTVTVGGAMLDAGQRLSIAGIETARLDARLLLCHVLDCDQARLLAYPKAPLTSEQESTLRSLLERRVRREPMAHILGHREFWKLDFMVSADTLVPRPDSETIIEAALEYIPDQNANINILDLGTATGCLVLSLLDEFPKAYGVGVDISVSALAVAAANAVALGLDDRVGFVGGNWGCAVEGRFDLIVANPPYIADVDIDALEPEVAVFEPRSALAGGADGLECYRAMIPYLTNLATVNAIIVMEIGLGQTSAVAGIVRNAGLQVIDIKHDLYGIERCVVVSRSDCPPGLKKRVGKRLFPD